MQLVHPLPYGSPIDLTNCEREPIHTPGHVQSHGAMLVMELETHRLLQVSDNSLAVLGAAADTLVGKPLAALLPEEVFDTLKPRLEHATRLPPHPFPQVIYRGPFIGKQAVTLSVHANEGLSILEAETESESPGAPEAARHREGQLLTLLGDAQLVLDGCTELRKFCQLLTEQIRGITGYDRVMVYRFAPDWHGWVYAEAMREGLHPFLDLHYPSSDIPAQARQLFLVNGARLLVDAKAPSARMIPELLTDGRPADMSYAALRGASQMYTEYLNNMGVRGTFTLALPRNGQLWGLVACHHYDEPRYLPPEMRSACALIAKFAGARIGELSDREHAQERLNLDRKRVKAVELLARSDDLVEGLRTSVPELARLLPASGFSAYLGGEFHHHGSVPEPKVATAILELLKKRPMDQVANIEHLSKLDPSLAMHAKDAAGILAVPIDHSNGAWLIWYRQEQVRSVNWAGDPHKPVDIGPFGARLTPRKSFELWCETVKGQCHPFSEAELDATAQLRMALSDVLFRERARLQKLMRELELRNSELDSFNTVASHDLREPLRAIANYTAFLEEDIGETLDEDSRTHLRHIRRLVQRMYALIEGLLSFSRLGKAPMAAERVNLAELVEKVKIDFSHSIAESKGTISILGTLPTIRSWELGLNEILANLIGNALKYSDEPPRVEIGDASASHGRRPDGSEYTHVVYVRDYGIGIPPEHVETVFRIFQRLHRDGRYGTGTGTGLPIVRRLVDRLQGRIWVEAAAKGSIFFLALNDLAQVGEPPTAQAPAGPMTAPP